MADWIAGYVSATVLAPAAWPSTVVLNVFQSIARRLSEFACINASTSSR